VIKVIQFMEYDILQLSFKSGHFYNCLSFNVTKQDTYFIHIHYILHQDFNHVYQAFWETQVNR